MVDEELLDLLAQSAQSVHTVVSSSSSSSSDDKKMSRRCSVVFGRRICLCHFLEFLGADQIDHLCYPKQTVQQKMSTQPIAKGPAHVGSEAERQRDAAQHQRTATKQRAKEHEALHKLLRTTRVESAVNSKRSPSLPSVGRAFVHYKSYGLDRANSKSALANSKQKVLSAVKAQRRAVISGLPATRPLWLPHLYWRWLHSAPRAHLWRHGKKERHSAAHIEEAEEGVDFGFDGSAESQRVSREMWRVQTVLLFVFVAVLLALMVCCLLRRSVWAQWLMQRRRRRLHSKARQNEEEEDGDSSSLNISDVSQMNGNDGV